MQFDNIHSDNVQQLPNVAFLNYFNFLNFKLKNIGNVAEYGQHVAESSQIVYHQKIESALTLSKLFQCFAMIAAFRQYFVANIFAHLL